MSSRQLMRSALLLRRGALLLRAEAAGIADAHTRAPSDWTGEPEAQRAHAELITTAGAMETQARINEQLPIPMHEVIAIARIEREARAAVASGQSIDESCPYPFGTDAAHHFKAAWHEARTQRAAAQRAAQETTHA